MATDEWPSAATRSWGQHHPPGRGKHGLVAGVGVVQLDPLEAIRPRRRAPIRATRVLPAGHVPKSRGEKDDTIQRSAQEGVVAVKPSWSRFAT